VPTLLLVSIVVWLSSLGMTPLSLDALIFARRGRSTRGKRGDASSRFPDEIPASVKTAPINVSYDPEASLGTPGDAGQ
jgi:hypothetical protein